MKRTILACAVALVAVAPALAQGKQVIWATDWDEALKEAKARNVPILWSLHQDN